MNNEDRIQNKDIVIRAIWLASRHKIDYTSNEELELSDDAPANRFAEARAPIFAPQRNFLAEQFTSQDLFSTYTDVAIPS
jgi:hypothetical protein